MEEETGKDDVDNEVFRKQYIPQTLEQVYDIERDAEQYQRGTGDALVYKDLLADKVMGLANNTMESSKAEQQMLDSDEDSTPQSADDDSENESITSKPPRGKRFQDKDAKKEHKKQVKEEKREARSKKMPKSVKKRLISQSSRPKR